MYCMVFIYVCMVAHIVHWVRTVQCVKVHNTLLVTHHKKDQTKTDNEQIHTYNTANLALF